MEKILVPWVHNSPSPIDQGAPQLNGRPQTGEVTVLRFLISWASTASSQLLSAEVQHHGLCLRFWTQPATASPSRANPPRASVWCALNTTHQSSLTRRWTWRWTWREVILSHSSFAVRGVQWHTALRGCTTLCPETRKGYLGPLSVADLNLSKSWVYTTSSSCLMWMWIGGSTLKQGFVYKAMGSL